MNKFYISESPTGQYYFTLTASNGQTIIHSDMYNTKEGCENGINTVKRIAENSGIEDLTHD